MDGEEEQATPAGETENATPDESRSTPDVGRKSRNLKEATLHLKEEALRRYKLKHGHDAPADADLGRETPGAGEADTDGAMDGGKADIETGTSQEELKVDADVEMKKSGDVDAAEEDADAGGSSLKQGEATQSPSQPGVTGSVDKSGLATGNNDKNDTELNSVPNLTVDKETDKPVDTEEARPKDDEDTDISAAGASRAKTDDQESSQSEVMQGGMAAVDTAAVAEDYGTGKAVDSSLPPAEPRSLEPSQGETTQEPDDAPVEGGATTDEGTVNVNETGPEQAEQSEDKQEEGAPEPGQEKSEESAAAQDPESKQEAEAESQDDPKTETTAEGQKEIASGDQKETTGEDQKETTEEAADNAGMLQEAEGSPAQAEGEAPAAAPQQDGQEDAKEKGQLDEQSTEKPPEQTGDGSGVESGDRSGDRSGDKPQEQSEEAKEGEVTQEEVKSDETTDQTAKTGEVTGDGEAAGESNQNEEGGDADQSQNALEEEGDAQDAEPEVLIPGDFYYNFQEQVSKAKVTQDSGLPEDLLSLQHSFGYDCRRRANLFMLDSRTLIFIAGNLVQLLDINTKEQRYIRSTSGGGIGALAVHPSRKYFAAAEKGNVPNINIFEFPSLKLYRILRGGTEKSYSSLDFSSDGELLTSVGGDPDFMLTVWNWKQEKTMLRSKAFSQEVFRATFSTELEGQLTTAGTGHIRFWKMADTFTGLKLQGELGRFGKTEISDIDGYVELPDGKVLSGSEWGNMLLWEGGLIKVEIARKNKKPCHNGAIQQILLDEGELMTIGVDGFIRMWDFESIDTADSTDDTALFEMEPMNELQVNPDAQLRSIVKSVDDENQPTIWYSQDANGGIWRLDLSFSHTSQAPEKLMTYHAGPITDCSVSPITHLTATIGLDNTVRVFDYVQQKQVCEGRYTASGTCLLWTPRIVDTKGSTLVAGFEDGVVRVLTVNKLPKQTRQRAKTEECEMALKQVFKPHKTKVTALAIDNRGEMLASGGDDNTVFFMNIGNKKLEPIGYVPVPAAVRSMQWSPDKFKKTSLLVFCEEGKVVEIQAPEPGKFDTSHSYHITGLQMKTFTFRSIKSRLRHDEEMERKRIEEEARKKKEEEDRRKRIERGLETESEHGDDEEEEKKPKEEDWHPYIPEVPSPIMQGFYSQEGCFWLSMGGFDAGYLYECKFLTEEEKSAMAEQLVDEPIRTVPVLESDDVPVSVIQFSNSGQQALFGMENGMIRVQQLENKFDIADLGPYWALSIHDNNYGHVTALKVSYDGTTLLSVGADGNFFQFAFMDDEKLVKKIAENKAKIPSARKQEERDRTIDDIDDPNAYSIEDAKQKSEYDKMMKEAEEKKRDVRRSISKLRRQFRGVLEKNESLPKHIQLGKGEFEMDREIKSELEKQTNEKIEVVRRELAWESEKHRIALEKLRKRFKDVVECERIVLKAFLTPHEVASFRASKLSDDFYQLKADFERRRTLYLTKDDLTRDPTRDMSVGKLRGEDSGDGSGEKTDESMGAKVVTTLKGSMGERITKALKKVEEKKKKRAARRAQWEDLYIQKPDDDYEDPADVSAIKEAKENMGDYKLKTAPDYVVPDHLRMNVEKARGRLLILKDLIHEYKYNFNVKLLALRDKKIRIIEDIRRHVHQLHTVQTRLFPDRHKPLPNIPDMHMEELPEKRLEYTRETLLQFKKDMESQRIAEQKTKAGGSGFGAGFGGFSGGGGGGGGGAGEQKAPSHTTQPRASPPLATKQSSLVSAPKTQASSVTADTEGEEELSPLEQQIRQIEEIRLIYEQDDILNKIEELVKNFDAELRLLRHDKFELDIVMKNADLRQVTLFEELVLLKEYEKREDVLAAKVTGKQQEKLDMQNKILEVQGKMDGKKKDIEKLQEKERALHATFITSLGDNNKFADYLTKVFKKKIKRTKKKTAEGDGSDEDSDEDSDDESDWEESDEESDEEAGGFDLDVCPPGCDQTLYDNTCQLREKRLDLEEALAEERKNQDTMKKELEGLSKKARVIDGALKTAQNDLEAFQLEKQQKLNELNVVVTLKLNQIQYMLNNVLPQDLSQTLVFESNGVVRLQQRIKELEHEKFLQKKQMKESRRKHVQLIKDRKVFEQKIVEMDETCNQMMVSKFGRIVDLEKLETVTVNRSIEELKEKCHITEIQCAEELCQWDKLIAEKRSRITDLIRDNTNRLEQLNMLMMEKKDLEASLDSRQKNLGEEYTGQRKADLNEKQRLIQLVQLQAQEIDALKEEIMLLSRKGGHILPPAQPPLPQSPPNLHSINH
ncbi:cilia- and flagella-associated protein 44-like isoform X2 [Haliotis rufescens]|uniref:cilia- and flagella-associated protein 44-like isoform X2 n=1 Tax=Haliotis rufescens TaxID=6454 RepID=UPI00201EADD2|nr:cilia- and flagella-associated protein 44-like isoform X2 [Haliotis rufescens]